jgi:hypothetical protein
MRGLAPPAGRRSKRCRARRAARIPVAFAALKTLMHGYLRRGEDGAPLPEVHGTFLDAETAVQLVANTDILRSRALAGAYARLRSAGADVRDFHSITIDRDRVAAYAVALMTPADARRVRRSGDVAA